MLQNNDPVLNETCELLGIAKCKTQDQLIRDMLASTASAINCTGGSNGDNPTQITISDINEATTQLLNNDAWTILDNIQGEDRFATAPVRAAYFGMCHTNLTKSLENVTGFVNKWNYASPQNTLRSEWGAAGNCRFLVSSVGSVTPNASNRGADVYNVLISGQEAYGVVEQDGLTSAFLYLPAIFSGPVGLNASVAVKFMQVPRILQDLWIVNLRATI